MTGQRLVISRESMYEKESKSEVVIDNGQYIGLRILK